MTKINSRCAIAFSENLVIKEASTILSDSKMHLYQLKPRKNSSCLRKLFWQLRIYKTLIWITILLISIWSLLNIYSMKKNAYTMERESKFVLGLNSKKYSYNRDMPLIFIGGVPRLEVVKLKFLLKQNLKQFYLL